MLAGIFLVRILAGIFLATILAGIPLARILAGILAGILLAGLAAILAQVPWDNLGTCSVGGIGVGVNG